MAHTPESLSTASTFLFVPGSRPDRFDRAAAAGADVVVLDLEDAVAPEGKDGAMIDKPVVDKPVVDKPVVDRARAVLARAGERNGS